LLNLNTVTHCSYNYEKYYIDESYKQEIPTSLTTQAVEVAGSESGGVTGAAGGRSGCRRRTGSGSGRQ